MDSFGRIKPLSKLFEGQTGRILYVCCRGFSRSQNVHLQILGHLSNLYQKLHFTLINTNKKTHLNPAPLWCFPTTQNITDQDTVRQPVVMTGYLFPPNTTHAVLSLDKHTNKGGKKKLSIHQIAYLNHITEYAPAESQKCNYLNNNKKLWRKADCFLHKKLTGDENNIFDPAAKF